MSQGNSHQSKPDFIVICGVAIEKDGKYLLVQEKKPEVFGKWNLPGGWLDEGETPEQAAIREAKEETGLDVELEREVLVLERPTREFHVFYATITGGELKIRDEELLDAKWFVYDEIVDMKAELRDAEYILGAIESARNHD